MVVKHSPKVPKGPKEEKKKKEKKEKLESATAKNAKKVTKKKEEKPEDETKDPDPEEGTSGGGDRKPSGEDGKNPEPQSSAESSGEESSSEDSSSDDPTELQSSSESEDEPEDGNEDLNLLIYKRGQVKAKVTRIRSTLRTSRKQMNLPRVQVMQKNLQTYYSEYTSYHSEILNSVDKKGRKAHEIKYQDFEELYTETLVSLQTLELKLTTPTLPVQPQQVPGGTERVVIHQQSLKAPLPSFDGEYENWPKFKSMFLDLMKHSQDSDAIKLYHLERCLVGAAAGVIDIQTINDNNYARAWELLEEQFDNKRNIIDKHIRGLTMIPPMTKESFKQLRKLLDECTRHVGHLEFLGQKLEGVSELMVINFLSDALDDETRKLWEGTLEKGQLPNYKDTIEFLKKRCQILERCRKTASTAAAKPLQIATPVKTTTRVHVATSHSGSGYACHLCSKTHETFRCAEFRALSTEAREKRVREVNACYNCLRKGHRQHECRSTRNCGICNARHNTLLHPNSPAKNTHDNSNQLHSEEDSDSSSESQQHEAAPPQGSSQSVICSCSMPQTPSQMLLMTAVVQVYDRDGKLHPCRAFIDPGSMSHMVSKRLAMKLGLPTTPAFVTVSGINGTQSTAKNRVAIEVKSRTTAFQARINCLVLDGVTGPLPQNDIDISSWGVPTGFDLADPQFNTSGEIDLLIGCGLFWQLLVPGKLSIGDGLPEFRNSKLGWIATGECSTTEEAAETVVVHSNAAIVSPIEARVQQEPEVVPDSSTSTNDEEARDQQHRVQQNRNKRGNPTLEKRRGRDPDQRALQHNKKSSESLNSPRYKPQHLPNRVDWRPPTKQLAEHRERDPKEDAVLSGAKANRRQPQQKLVAYEGSSRPPQIVQNQIKPETRNVVNNVSISSSLYNGAPINEPRSSPSRVQSNATSQERAGQQQYRSAPSRWQHTQQQFGRRCRSVNQLHGRPWRSSPNVNQSEQSWRSGRNNEQVLAATVRSPWKRTESSSNPVSSVVLSGLRAPTAMKEDLKNSSASASYSSGGENVRTLTVSEV